MRRKPVTIDCALRVLGGENYPFAAPSVRPVMKQRWKKTKMNNVGSDASGEKRFSLQPQRVCPGSAAGFAPHGHPQPARIHIRQVEFRLRQPDAAGPPNDAGPLAT